MYRIRFHGRGGQGLKTASRILGSTFFLSGYEVQDAPRYGAERRGAPIFAYVRAQHSSIHERGIIENPDLVIVSDDSLIGVSAAGVLQGLNKHSVLLIATNETPLVWSERLKIDSRIITLEPLNTEQNNEIPYNSIACIGAAVRLIGNLQKKTLIEALENELTGMEMSVIGNNIKHATAAFAAMSANEGCIIEGMSSASQKLADVNWIDLPLDAPWIAAPTIHTGLTSHLVRTGLWRTMRPVLELTPCNKCTWICASVCPDGVISVGDDGYPDIDYDHCKGCMVCVAQCPRHALQAIPEREAAKAEGGIS